MMAKEGSGMKDRIETGLSALLQDGRFDGKRIVLWGIGNATEKMIQWFRKENIAIDCIVDNFKYEFFETYQGVPVKNPRVLANAPDGVLVLLATHYVKAIRAQLRAYGVDAVYNLYQMDEMMEEAGCDIPYSFIDRRQGKKILCYILAGYEPDLWDGVLTRIHAYQDDAIDYCIASSGIKSERLAFLAEQYGWSYVSTERNQVGYIQNVVIELHPNAEYIFKLDEDIFIGADFFQRMMAAYQSAAETGEYRINFLAPIIPLNCSSYVSYLKAKGLLADFTQRFGRAYRGRFSAPFSRADAALYLWSLCRCFDEETVFFSKNTGYAICDSYYNIGCILYTRERWLLMGKWPQCMDDAGMGVDEQTILQDGHEKDMAIYEMQGILVGHLGFGPQKVQMKRYYKEHPEVFAIHRNL